MLLRLYWRRTFVEEPQREKENPLPSLRALATLFASLYRHDNTYHNLCYTTRGGGILAGAEKIQMIGPLTSFDRKSETLQMN